MMFPIVKYIQPIWYYNLLPKADEFSTFIHHPTANRIEGDSLCLDHQYETDRAKYLDIGYRYWWKGGMNTIDRKGMDQFNEDFQTPLTLKDQYIFIRKHWKPQWANYVFLRRLLAFRNPLREFKAFRATKHIEYLDLCSNPLPFSGYEKFESNLVKTGPRVSVIIPTLNRYEYLQDVLFDLEKQDFRNFDVIVIDQSDQFDASFYEKFKLVIKVIYQQEKLLWTARNRAVRVTDSEFLLFFDDDSRVEPDWISQHLKCLDYFDAQISAGVSISKIGAKVPKSYSYFRWADQFDSGNAMVRRSVFEQIGLFDLQFNKQRMGDGEFGIRAYMSGFKSVSNPYAKRLHLKVPSGGLREMGSWDGFRPKKMFAPKPIPSVIYFYKKYFPKDFAREGVILGVSMSNVKFHHKSSKAMMLFSLLLTLFLLPKLLIQVGRAYNEANKMLRHGDQIEYLSA
jgi:glycosyltransferase involved in cell wall biosynthesis